MIWRVDFAGRSTPVVMDGRVYVAGRVGEGIHKQEQVACFDAESGRLLWERRLNVFLTSVPFPRVGWASPAVDPETGNVYFHGVGGLLICFDRDGETLWQHSLTEEYGRISGYGGRTVTPLVAGDLVVLGFATSSWGNLAVPRHRHFAFDKRNGQAVWVSTPGAAPADLNTYSTPVAAEIGGRQLMIGGDGDGAVYALTLTTGEKVWGFRLSKRGLNSSVVVEDDRVYATHSEENLDSATMGRVVAIDATGSGDVTETHELWRHDQFAAGFVSPALHEGRLFVIDNSANLNVLDSRTGRVVWEHSLGTVGKGSPVIADGKLFATEVNGTFHVIDISGDDFKRLSTTQLRIGDRYAEIYGSPAVAGGRVYFATEEGLYCLGDPGVPFRAGSGSRLGKTVAYPEPGVAAQLQIFPAELSLFSGQKVQMKARTFDAKGVLVSEVAPEWQLEGINGTFGPDASFTAGGVDRPRDGSMLARHAGLVARVRARIYPPLPWSEDFESLEEGRYPNHWIGAFGKFGVKTLEDGNKVLEKPRIQRGIQRAYVYLGPSTLSNYEIQVDLRGNRQRRRVPDMGLVANRYILSLDGNSQQLSVHSWASEKRMAREVDFPWESDTWYRMKMRVDLDAGKAVIRGKVWLRDQEEPANWSIEVEDPHPNQQGSPGLYGQSYFSIYYDNLKITGTKK